jgi:hypothetical protein
MSRPPDQIDRAKLRVADFAAAGWNKRTSPSVNFLCVLAAAERGEDAIGARDVQIVG